MFKVGSIVKITNEINGHEFKIGKHVRIVEPFDSDDGTYKAELLDGSDYWYISEEEFKFVSDN